MLFKKKHSKKEALMNDNPFATIIIAISIWVFAASCQGIQKTEEQQEKSELQKATSSHKEEGEVVFNFDEDAEGDLPKGWTSAKTGKGGLGKWLVMKDDSAPSMPNVLAQISKKNLGYHFSIAFADNTHYADVEIELMFKAVDGQEDQGGGPVWRYVDADNYYVCRANPLESNFRVYKVVDGDRRKLQSAKLTIPSNQWHHMKIKNTGNHIQCWLNEKLYLDVKDDAFQEGKVGVWTKADAVTYFDNFEVEVGG